MTWPSLVRRAARRRHSEQPDGTISSRPSSRRDERTGARLEQPDRHPAMARIDVSPVHGRHCDCERCRRAEHAAELERSDRRPAA